MNQKTILLIEDNDDIRFNSAEILGLSNYNVITAENGKVGIEKAIQYKPDLIICDIMMPVLDGYAVLHAIQKNDAIRNTPFIFLTAKTERNDFRKGMELGADDYITKPFDGTELLKAVDGRIKKAERMKEEAGMMSIEQTDVKKESAVQDVLREFTEGRNWNIYKRKQAIYAEGNHPNRLYYILDGKVKTSKANESGKELVTDLYCKGDFLGHVALLEGTVYKDTAVALEDTKLAIIPKEDFDELINQHPEVAKKFIKLLARNISIKENQLLGLAYYSLRKKVAEALLLLQKKYRQSSDEIFSIDINRENLATIAGTATESVIRTLADFRNEKLIDLKDGVITILNSRKLELLSN